MKSVAHSDRTMMSFAEFAKLYLHHRIQSESRRQEANIMAHAYYLLSNDHHEKRAADEFCRLIEEKKIS